MKSSTCMPKSVFFLLRSVYNSRAEVSHSHSVFCLKRLILLCAKPKRVLVEVNTTCCLLGWVETEPDCLRAIKCLSVWVKEKPSRWFCQIVYEAFATDPFISVGFTLFYFLSAALLSTLVIFSFFSRVLCFTLSHFSLAFLTHFLSVFLPLLLFRCHMGILLLCVFFIFFTSVLLFHICEIWSRCSYNSI